MDIGMALERNIIYEINNGNGKIKYYDDNDELKSEGNYLNGKRHGFGKEYNYIGQLIYEGNYINGERS